MISTKKESDFAKCFQKSGVKFIEKGFKCKTVVCTRSDCNQENDVFMQHGVDNSITVEVFRRYINCEKSNNKKLKTVVLLTGDGDFLDLADMFKDELMIDFFISSFKCSINDELIGAVGEENIFYLDEIEFKEENRPSQETKAKLPLSRKMMGLSLTREPVHQSLLAELNEPKPDVQDQNVRLSRFTQFARDSKSQVRILENSPLQKR